MHITIYARVSTEEQGDSGLGLDAQLRLCEAFIARQYPDAIVTAFQEVESGGVAARPILLNALAHCRQTKGTLVVARHDRLTRLPAQCLTLLEEFEDRLVDASNPHADAFQWGINGLCAGRERKLISVRTTEAMASIKARIKAHGSHRTKDGSEIYKLGGTAQVKAGRASGVARRRKRQAYMPNPKSGKYISEYIEQAKGNGHTSLRAIARELNGYDVKAPNGGVWHHTTLRAYV